MAEPTRHHTIKTLAARWSLSPGWVRQRILRGELAAQRYGKLWRIPVAVVEAYEREVSTCATESETSQDGAISTSSGRKLVGLEPYQREAMIARKLRRFSRR